MSIKVECCRCQEELTEPGALVFGPPHGAIVIKLHLCVICFQHMLGRMGINLTTVEERAR